MVFDGLKQKANQLGDLKRMRDQAVQIQRELAAEQVVEEQGGIRVVLAGDQQVKEIQINDEDQSELVGVLNKAIRRSQEIAAKKLQQMSGGLSGLLGR